MERAPGRRRTAARFGGYETFLATMADPDAPENTEIRRWCGGHFDPDWFDRAVVDEDLKTALKPNVRRRLHQPKPIRSERRSKSTPSRPRNCRYTGSGFRCEVSRSASLGKSLLQIRT